MKNTGALLAVLAILNSCSINRQIAKQAKPLLQDSAVSTGHIGISIYEPATGKYWYNYNSSHYFIPASNTKLFTLYAGMKYLGDSLVGLRYQNFSDSALNLLPTADPTFLHADFPKQPVLDFLKQQTKALYINEVGNVEPLGYGWAWDDYNSSYMAERNSFPVYGNTITISLNGFKETRNEYALPDWNVLPRYFLNYIPDFFALDAKTKLSHRDSSEHKNLATRFTVYRDKTGNKMNLLQSTTVFKSSEIPFVTNGVNTAVDILKSELNTKLINGILADNSLYPEIPSHLQWHAIHSQPSDSLFKPMMHRSDNFFAEQTLLMASNEYLGYMSDEKMIDTILKTTLKDAPQKPKWVDGSGLSRYNLFTPADFVYILNKMKDEFGMNRMKTILATGGEGTISSYYKKEAGYIYAKTGTLSNNCALSGYLFTQKGKLLIFSVLNNNYISGATPVRRAVERFLESIQQKF